MATTLSSSLWMQEAKKLTSLEEGKQRRKEKRREESRAARRERKAPKRPGSYY